MKSVLGWNKRRTGELQERQGAQRERAPRGQQDGAQGSTPDAPAPHPEGDVDRGEAEGAVRVAEEALHAPSFANVPGEHGEGESGTSRNINLQWR